MVDRGADRLVDREALRGAEREELLWPVEAHVWAAASIRQIARARLRNMLSDYIGGLGRAQ